MNTTAPEFAHTSVPEPTPLQQFGWAMQRLAHMQGGSIDMLSLNASAAALEQPFPPIQTLAIVCQRMGLSKPKLLKQPDRVHLPMLCHTPELGWGVVVDRNPLGLWMVMRSGPCVACNLRRLERGILLYLRQEGRDAGGVVDLEFDHRLAQRLDGASSNQVDGWLAVNADGSVTVGE